MEPEVLEFNIAQAIETNDEERIRELYEVLRQSIINKTNERFQYFSLLVRLLNRKEFVELSIAWDYFFLLKNYRELLTDMQRLRLLSKLPFIYSYFDEKNIDFLKSELYKALLVGDKDEFKNCLEGLESGFFGVNHFPGEVFDFCVNLFHDQALLAFDDSWYLINIFNTNWELLSFEQQNSLLCELELAFGKFKHWMSNFLITEILGNRYGDDRALNILSKLKMIEAEDPRSLIPHGLEHIILKSRNTSLTHQAYSELVEMRDDPSIKVRDEVNATMLKVQNLLHLTGTKD